MYNHFLSAILTLGVVSGVSLGQSTPPRFPSPPTSPAPYDKQEDEDMAPPPRTFDRTRPPALEEPPRIPYKEPAKDRKLPPAAGSRSRVVEDPLHMPRKVEEPLHLPRKVERRPSKPDLGGVQRSMQALEKSRGELEAERDKINQILAETHSSERDRTIAALEDRLKKLRQSNIAQSDNSEAQPSEPRRGQKSRPSKKPAGAKDPLAAAQNYFQAGDIEEALKTYRSIDLDDRELKSEDRLLIQYMTATCLRKLGRLKEAEELYQTVAASEDPEDKELRLKEFAKEQLDLIHALQQIESQKKK